MTQHNYSAPSPGWIYGSAGFLYGTGLERLQGPGPLPWWAFLVAGSLVALLARVGRAGGQAVTYVYTLSTYDEHGAEDMVATLDRSKLVSLIETFEPESWGLNANDDLAWKNEAIEKVKSLLEKPDEELGDGQANNLHRGWGGMQLHVTRVL